MSRSIGATLRGRWRALSGLPGGRWLFSRLLGLKVPYTGKLRANIEVLEPGRCVVSLRERRALRNHLRSVHAMALSNLGEMATGLALLNSLPDGMRGILAGFNIVYIKKARGQLRAESRCEVPASTERTEIAVTGEIRDNTDEIVATLTAQWLVGPEK